MAKFGIPTPSLGVALFKGWTGVVIFGLLLALVAVIDRGGLSAVTPSSGSTGCALRVTVAELNVRSSPSQTAPQVQTLAQGATVDGTRVVTGGFRQLADGHWVFDQYVTPMPGSTCG
ncbi:MAG: hypothetical protein QOG20_5032 [Pseudonocardiales bacterium]|jgi:hypothetical protein|uniref:hypothetical protein n=1 Tax=Pseudonocardia sp. TaxID=60912 RepID=UPI00262251EC|nr:hypothetical protein [Pseudonocardia sp.]MCW2720245.1 hypothetical protein [Pseudonocardia sp.]MDT7618620.1 hypothetical protein [Pseudonocardiales bacterium]MDT7709425.1 hypothetical protein [Pseudonocardiales bacterium]